MELKLKNNKLFLGGKCVELTCEQLKKLGLNSILFDMKKEDKCFWICWDGDVIYSRYNGTASEKNALENGKLCKDEKLMKQKALRQNLNDRLWKFTIENGWKDELWEDNSIKKWGIGFDYEDKVYSLEWRTFDKTQGVIYFISDEIAQRAIEEIVKPYVKEYPDFIW